MYQKCTDFSKLVHSGLASVCSTTVSACGLALHTPCCIHLACTPQISGPASIFLKQGTKNGGQVFLCTKNVPKVYQKCTEISFYGNNEVKCTEKKGFGTLTLWGWGGAPLAPNWLKFRIWAEEGRTHAAQKVPMKTTVPVAHNPYPTVA